MELGDLGPQFKARSPCWPATLLTTIAQALVLSVIGSIAIRKGPQII